MTACTHGRGVTVTSSAAVDRLATVIVASAPGWALCSITAGMTDSPPSFVWAADPPAAAPCTAAVPPAPSAVSTAPSATYRFMLPSPCRSERLALGDFFFFSTLILMLTCERCRRVGEAEDQRPRAARVLQEILKRPLSRDPRAGLGDGLLADLVEELDPRALRRRDRRLPLTTQVRRPVEAVALAVLQHRRADFETRSGFWLSETDRRGERQAAAWRAGHAAVFGLAFGCGSGVDDRARADVQRLRRRAEHRVPDLERLPQRLGRRAGPGVAGGVVDDDAAVVDALGERRRVDVPRGASRPSRQRFGSSGRSIVVSPGRARCRCRSARWRCATARVVVGRRGDRSPGVAEADAHPRSRWRRASRTG